MKIIIEYETQCPFLFAISKILSAATNDVILWSPSKKTIYEMIHQITPDLLIISNNKTSEHWKLIGNTPYIICGQIDNGRKAVAKLPIFDKDQKGFVDLLTYRGEFSNDLFSTDILVSSNFFNGDMSSLLLMDKIFQETDFTIKCIGNTVIPSYFFIGQTDEKDFMSIAKASKIVIASNQIEKMSLLYNKIYACTADEFNEETYKIITEEKLRRKYIKEERKKIIDDNRLSSSIVTKILKTINLPEEAQKIEQITGNLL